MDACEEDLIKNLGDKMEGKDDTKFRKEIEEKLAGSVNKLSQEMLERMRIFNTVLKNKVEYLEGEKTAILKELEEWKKLISRDVKEE